MYVLSDGDNLPLQTINLGSISGVVAATMLAVEVLKRALKRVTFFEKVPVFVYAFILAILFGTLANRVIHTNQTDVPARRRVLEGDLGLCDRRSGSEWLLHLATQSGNGQDRQHNHWNGDCERIPISSMGCGSGNTPQHITLRESMDQSNKTFQAEDIDWATKLMVNADGKDQRDQLPRLTPKDLQRRVDTKAEYDRLVTEDRARDAQGSPLDILFGKKPTTQP
jgi:hypothetical protein